MRDDLDMTQTAPMRAGLSADQYRIWFLHQINETLNHFNINFAFGIEGALDVEALRAALTDLGRRHEALRTAFLAQDGVPYLQITSAEAFNGALEVIPFDDGPGADGQIRRQMTEAGKVPFRLDRGPMFRVQLFRLSDSRFRMLFTIHHIIADFDSLKLIMKELFHLYRQRVRGDVAPLPVLTRQFSDYAQCQNERIAAGELDGQLDYWKTQLSGEIPVLEMPMDRPRGAAPSNNGATRRIVFSRSLTDRLQALSRENSVTLFITLISAYQVLLHKYTRQDDIRIGTPITTRSDAELRAMVGLFINTLVLKSDLSGDPQFLELLQRNRKIVFGAFARQEIPYEKLVAELKPDRNLNHNLFFQTMVMFLEPEIFATEMVPGVSVVPFEIDKRTTTFELTLSFSYINEALTLLVDYNTDLFDETTIAYFMQRFEIMLEKLTADPAQKIKALSLLTPEEEEATLALWQGRQGVVPGGQTFGDLWAARVAATPEAIALEHRGTRLSYAALDARVDLFARALAARGVGAGHLVPVLAERNTDMVALFLAVLRCGAAYVPLNPCDPRERRDEVLARCRGTVQVTTAETTDRADVLTVQALLADTPEGAAAMPQLHPLDVAYVIFTSGSTGTPKGVMISHDSLVNHCYNMIDRFELTAADRVLQFTQPSFDVSVQEIFPTLVQGATLVLWEQAGVEATEPFLHWLDDHRISVLNMTTAHWHSLVADARHGGLAFPETLRLLIVGGEKAQPAMLRDWSEMVQGRIAWINDFGLTETTVTASMYRHEGATFDGDTVPIGSPLDEVSIMVLDDAMAPCALGVYGNIFIGGRGVALGYHGDAALTRERFVSNPFGKTRLFRTGDIGRIRLDGTLEFDSREDAQIKIRGNRVEIGEVERHILECPGVRETFLRVHRQQKSGTAVLVAYLVVQDAALQIETLRAALKQRLPNYMVPAFFVLLDALPLTGNGKVDVKQLPMPCEEMQPEARFVVPASKTEKQLAQLWAQLLGQETVGATDSFFDIGGDSLIATTLVARIRSDMGLNLPLHSLFETPRLCDLAATVDLLQSGEAVGSSADRLVRMQPRGMGMPLFYVHPVGGTVSCYLGLSRHMGETQPFYAIQSHAMVRRDYGLKTVEQLAEMYLEDIRAVQPHGPYRLGGWSMGGFIAYEIARLLLDRGEEVEELSMIDSYLTKTRVADERTVMFNFVLQLAAMPGKSVDLDEMMAWKERDFDFDEIWAELRRRGLIPEGTSDAHVRHLFDVYMATVATFKCYDPAPSAPIAVPRAVLFRARDSHEELGIWPRLLREVELHHVDADHFGIVHHPSIASVLTQAPIAGQ